MYDVSKDLKTALDLLKINVPQNNHAFKRMLQAKTKWHYTDRSAPPQAYKLSMFFWSTILAYSSKNSLVGDSWSRPA